jgi:hypothetical protein
MCAGGLPGAENLDPNRYLDWLYEAARTAKFNTERHWYRFHARPAFYNTSPGYFCCYHLLQTLQEDFGVRYNPARVRDPKFQDPKCIDPDFKDSRDLFIHGLIDGPGGTCASMPVLYVAVGRRLGYPLKLVEARGHLFVRWDDPLGKRLGVAEFFNVEGAGEGIASYPDEFYRTWPEPWSEKETAAGCYLKSLSSAEELGAFLVTRAECLHDNGRIDEALQAYSWACSLVPHDPRYQAHYRKVAFRKMLAYEEQQLAMEDAKRRRREALERGVGRAPAGDRSQVPPHDWTCECADCRSAVAAAGPPHGETCQCASCRRARDLSRVRELPGHPRGCICPGCRPIHSQASLGGGCSTLTW